jgi:hypothetical protein
MAGKKVTLRGRWRRTATYNKVVSIAALFTAVATIAYAAFALMQWSAMKSQLQEIQKGSTDTHALAVQAKNQADRTKEVADNALKQANATNDLAKQAKRSANTADSSLAAVRENFIVEQRPYIWFQPNHPKLEIGKPILWDVDLKNYGRTPAIHVKICTNMLIGEDPVKDLTEEKIASWCAEKNGPESSVIAPPGFDMFSTALGPIIVDSKMMSFLKDKDRTLVLIGRVTYSDRFGKPYVSTFCSARLAAGGIWGCDKFNEIK